jgi:TonB family protein
MVLVIPFFILQAPKVYEFSISQAAIELRVKAKKKRSLANVPQRSLSSNERRISAVEEQKQSSMELQDSIELVTHHEGSLKPTSPIQPKYPELSKELGEEGKIILQAKINSKGEVVSVEVIQSSGYQRLDQSATQALSAVKFKGDVQKSPFPRVLNIAVSFVLDK